MPYTSSEDPSNQPLDISLDPIDPGTPLFPMSPVDQMYCLSKIAVDPMTPLEVHFDIALRPPL